MATRPMTGMGMPVVATKLSSTGKNANAPSILAFRIPGVLGGMIITRGRGVFVPLLAIGMRWRARRAATDSLDRLLKFEDHLLSDIGVNRLDVIAAIEDLRATSLWRSLLRHHRH